MLTSERSDIIGWPFRSPITSGNPPQSRNRRSRCFTPYFCAYCFHANSDLIYFHVLPGNMNQSPPDAQPVQGLPNGSSFAPSLRGPLAGGRQITRNRASYSCHTCRRRKVKCDKVDQSDRRQHRSPCSELTYLPFRYIQYVETA
jgi:hypothetical protein